MIMDHNQINSSKNISELRQDPVSGDWIVIATSRNKRPSEMASKKLDRLVTPIDKCPFEDFEASGNGPVLMEGSLPESKDWLVRFIENKFPALSGGIKSVKKTDVGPYEKINGYGHHEVVILKDHARPLSDYSVEELTVLLQSLQKRYRELAQDKKVKHISIYHNWGFSAGASIYHPHLQMIALPVVSSSAQRVFDGVRRYWKKKQKCPYCEIVNFELQDRKRVIFENEKSVLVTPYISREPFELRIYPKNHSPFFEDADFEETKSVAENLKRGLMILRDKVSDPDLNFFIHTTPVCDKKKSRDFHWHIEIIPRVCISAGFEIDTGIEITPMDPDEGAAFLKS